MNPVVLSLFDGASCFQMALKEAGIEPAKYYASEVLPNAIKQTMANFPDTIQLGDIRNVNVFELDKIDVICGGSPCKNLSFAGTRAGLTTIENIDVVTLEQYLQLKAENFEFNGESYLFWEYMRILNDVRKINTDVKFILENVRMGKYWERILSEAIGVFGVHINSYLVSAQNRPRIYWSNIKTESRGLFGEVYTAFPQPADRGIFLKDIVEKNVPEKYYLSEKMLKYFELRSANYNNGKVNIRDLNGKCSAILASYASCDISDNYISCDFRTDEGLRIKTDGKTGTMCARNREDESCGQLVIESCASRGRDGEQQLEFNGTGKTNCITTVCKDNYVAENRTRIRRMIPRECARAQTWPEWVKIAISDSAAYHAIGNGFTVEVFVEFLKHVKWN